MELIETTITDGNEYKVISSVNLAGRLGKHHDHVMRIIKNNIWQIGQSEYGDALPESFYFIPSQFKDKLGDTKDCYMIKSPGLVAVLSKFMTPELAFLVDECGAFGAIEHYDAAVTEKPAYVYLFWDKDTYYYRIGVSPDIEKSFSKLNDNDNLVQINLWGYESEYKAEIVGRYIYKAFNRFATRSGWFFFPEKPEKVVEKLDEFIATIN